MYGMDEVLGDTAAFVTTLVDELKAAYPSIHVTSLELDHICYRCDTKEEYLKVCAATAVFGTRIIESMIGSRPISVYELHEPLKVGGYSIAAIEIPCPKPGKKHPHGLEHAEFVIKAGTLAEFVQAHSAVTFDKKAMDKAINADVSLQIGNVGSVKFHEQPLYTVARHELATGTAVLVPPTYFATQ